MFESELFDTGRGEIGLTGGVLTVVLLGVMLVGATTGTAAAQSTTPNADFNVTMGEDSFSIEIEDPGNLDTIQLFAPDGTRSTETTGIIQEGITLRVSDSPDLNTTVIDPEDIGSSVPATDILGDTLSLGYTVDEETFECVALHDGYNFDGISVSSSQNHPCHTPVLGHFDVRGVLDFNSSLDFGSFEGGEPVPITYREGTYELVGTVGDNSAVVETVTVDGDGGGGLSPNNPFGNTGGNPVSRSTVISKIVQWNLNGSIDGTSYTRSDIVSFLVNWNLLSNRNGT